MAHLVTYKNEPGATSDKRLALKQDIADFNHAIPHIVSEAPADIAPLAQTYLTQLGEVLAVVATSKPGQKPSAKYVPPDLTKHPLSQQQVDNFQNYVQANCHFQMTNPNSAAAPPGSTPPSAPAPGAPVPAPPATSHP